MFVLYELENGERREITRRKNWLKAKELATYLALEGFDVLVVSKNVPMLYATAFEGELETESFCLNCGGFHRPGQCDDCQGEKK